MYIYYLLKLNSEINALFRLNHYCLLAIHNIIYTYKDLKMSSVTDKHDILKYQMLLTKNKRFGL